MTRIPVPLIIVLLFVAILLSIYGIKLYRGYTFTVACRQMLDHAGSGRLNQTSSFIIKSQQNQALSTMNAVAPRGYENMIRSLKLTSWSWSGDDSISAVVTCRLDYSEYQALYQGKLLWHLESGAWQWDFVNSYAAEFSASGEPDWVKLGDMLLTVEHP